MSDDPIIKLDRTFVQVPLLPDGNVQADIVERAQSGSNVSLKFYQGASFLSIPIIARRLTNKKTGPALGPTRKKRYSFTLMR